MSVKGDSCFPSIETLTNDTGLSKRAVIKHLQIARDLGWISVDRHGFDGQKWARNEYQATVPKSAKVVNVVHHLNDEKVVNDVHHVDAKVVNVVHEGGERGAPKVVNVVHPNRPYTRPITNQESVRAREAVSYRDTLPEEQTPQMKLYREFFPDANITSYQKQLVNSFNDSRALKAALEFWKGNDYKGRSVRTLLDKAREIASERSKSTEVTSLDNFD